MCWAQTVVDKSAPAQRNGQATAGNTSSDSQGSALTPDFLDESLLLDGFQDPVLGAWDGEPDFLLDQLLKQEVPDVFPTGPITSATSDKSEKTQPSNECYAEKSSSATNQIGQQQPIMMHPAMLQQQMQVSPMAQGMAPMMQAMPQLMQQLPQQAGFQNAAGGMMQQVQGLVTPGQVPANVAQMQMLAAMMASGGAAEAMMCGNNNINMANQMLMLAQQAGLSRGFKTQADLDEAIERVKKKRRESAQRSRARKNCYMKQLEEENKALKDENARLRASLSKFAKPEDLMNSAQVTPVWHQSVNSSTQETAMNGMQVPGNHYMAMVI